ncbi:MAG: ribonuclease III [Bacteroidales bacterium]|nr:ribonuclease III [Bacteroidales bacterium]
MALNHNDKKKSEISDPKKFRAALKKILGFSPSGSGVYETAFIHRSATFEAPDGNGINNERLEYLGDAILDAVLSEYLFRNYPEASEGELTKLRSRLVNRNTLNQLARSMNIDKLIISHISNNLSSGNIYGDALEALIGAIFIDKGYSRTRKFILRHILSKHIDLDSVINTETDYKSMVFEWAQKLQKQISFNYHEEYDFNDKKYIFTTVLRIDHEIFGEGTGTNKKEAEQKASLMAVKKINRTGFIK